MDARRLRPSIYAFKLLGLSVVTLLLLVPAMTQLEPSDAHAQGAEDGESRGLMLYEGFNEIYWGGPALSLADALGSIEDQLLAVFHWLNPEQQWLTYNPLLPGSLNTLTQFQQGEMFWIGVSETVVVIVPLPEATPLTFPGFGSDAELDALATLCSEGDLTACDDLFLESPVDSGYELYGDTCGGRQSADSRFFCTEAFPYS